MPTILKPAAVFPPLMPPSFRSTHAGLAMSQIELEKIADHFDRDKDGYIDLSEISSILRGLRRARSLAKKQPISDSEKIDYEVIVFIGWKLFISPSSFYRKISAS